MRATRGFTLVEILIVVVILGILAAIVIPQFTQASTEAKTNSLASDLQSLRSQIELFKVQHTDMAPGNKRTNNVVAASITDFNDQMLYVTDIDGNLKTPLTKIRDTAAEGSVFIYGPYLERIPDNPFNDSSGVQLVANKAAAEAITSSPNGWGYIPDTGEIFAIDGGTTPDGVLHADM